MLLSLKDVCARDQKLADQDKFCIALATSVFSVLLSENTEPVGLISRLGQVYCTRLALARGTYSHGQEVLADRALVVVVTGPAQSPHPSAS